ncbi:hypothetical protein WI41_14965 [Burkholderia latens]|uniref:Uncharacterized protein n=1 Tax=Burkholderia latens TaxID=488446 RepID=A0AAP1G9N1_9BURK|nr:hypothetical protein WI41_14965 [Burkholderia latens]
MKHPASVASARRCPDVETGSYGRRPRLEAAWERRAIACRAPSTTPRRGPTDSTRRRPLTRDARRMRHTVQTAGGVVRRSISADRAHRAARARRRSRLK